MIHDTFDDLLRETDLVGALGPPGAAVALAPLPGASTAALAAALARAITGPVVVVADTPNEADDLFADLETVGDPERATYFPQRESLPYEDSDPHLEISGQRVAALGLLLSGRARLVVTTARALIERFPLPAEGGSFALRLEEGVEVGLRALIDRLERMGFDRTHTIRELGEYAVRGGIVDVFPFGHDRPLRIELWGDEVASLRRFDLLTQRSVEKVERVDVLPIDLRPDAVSAGGDLEPSSLLEILPETALLFEPRADSGVERRRHLREEIEAARASRDAGLAADRLVLDPATAEDRIREFRRVRLEESGRSLGILPPPAIDRDMGRLVEEARRCLERGERLLILCDNEGQLERLEEILAERAGERLVRLVTLAIGSASGGFRVEPPGSVLLLTDHEIFRRSRGLRPGSRYRGVATLESIASIRPGDYVVHMDHGIGRYRGLARVEVGGETIETLEIEYAEKEILRLPHYRLDLLERWSPAGDGEPKHPPRVHKLGGRRWKRLKERTVASIERIARELLELYAHRRVARGHAFSAETAWQREMESAFLYDETPDQLSAWEAVRADMEDPAPMDRLVCGDVGFGKTEIAMRAAFKAVQDGVQVALLAPTTVLADQHLHTFRERLAAFPVRIEGLSRFLRPAAQRVVLDGLRDGQVDIVIGTHRLVSPDVAFANLGLVIVDEEQRFGVRQKERLKELRRSVDVLTLTATPIPRTLHLALGGVRDLSIIETAPRDRRPIITHLLTWDDGVLEDAIRRELDRGGQVFFVHDRVETIEAMATRVRRLVPEARMEVAHGQMNERALEEAMRGLMAREIEVLVCTSIIENGLDVATANTMIVHRADRFGLAQLYQLRGRVGRSHRRAHCYLIVPPEITPEAEKRLRVLEHHTELGSGYRVALTDLELRGAGNLLGAEQSGFATAVGLETYQRLVESTVRRLKGEGGDGVDRATQVALGGEAYLPDDYILGAEAKMHLYRRLSRMRRVEEVRELREELRDRFGPLPDPGDRLLAAAELRALGTAIEAEWIQATEETARITFLPNAVPRLTSLRDALVDRQLDVEVRRLQPLSLMLRKAGVEPLVPTLVEALGLLATVRVEPAGAAAGGG